MIVVAIIGILTTIALPLYQDYSTRTKISEAILAIADCKNKVSEGANTGLTDVGRTHFPKFEFGCDPRPSQYVRSINVHANGWIEVQLNIPNITRKLNGMYKDGGYGFLYFLPYSDDAGKQLMRWTDFKTGSNRPIKTWRCGISEVYPLLYLTVDPKYLPAECRNALALQ